MKLKRKVKISFPDLQHGHQYDTYVTLQDARPFEKVEVKVKNKYFKIHKLVVSAHVSQYDTIMVRIYNPNNYIVNLGETNVKITIKRMKLTPELKQRIDDYFDSNSAEHINEQMHKGIELSEYGHGYFAHKKETAKLLLDKLNHLKSELKQYTAPKLTKTTSEDKVNTLTAQIQLIQWLQKKLS